MNKFYKFEANGWALMTAGVLMLYGLISLIADCIKPWLSN